MSINLPENSDEIINRSKIDVQRELGGSNPFLKQHWLLALIVGYCNRIFDFYVQLNILLKELFWNTSTGEFLETQASWYGITKLAATTASGKLCATGVALTVITIDRDFTTSDGNVYSIDTQSTITTQVLGITSLTRSGSIVTATTDAALHNLGSNVKITIAGAVETDYNVTDTDIIVTGPNTFTYEIATTPTTPATGTITATGTFASVDITSDDFGSEQNLSLDTPLTVSPPISGLDNVANVNNEGITGGVDQESFDNLRLRFLDRVQNPIAHFNVAEITSKAKEINGVTRVFIDEATPLNGQVSIYFMKDNESNPIPTGTDVTNVKNKILEIKPANTADADVIVAAPTAVPTAFTFSSLSPNTATMQIAIQDNLEQFFSESTEVGVNIIQEAYLSAIYNTVDLETGDKVLDFALSAPTGDITIAAGEIGTLGTITYP